MAGSDRLSGSMSCCYGVLALVAMGVLVGPRAVHRAGIEFDLRRLLSFPESRVRSTSLMPSK